MSSLDKIHNRLWWVCYWLFMISVGSCTNNIPDRIKVELVAPDETMTETQIFSIPERGQRLPFTERVE